MADTKSGKIIPITRAALKLRSQALNLEQRQLITFKVDLAEPEALQRAQEILKFRNGDSLLVQDIKMVVIRRVAVEAHSRSWVRLGQAMTRLYAERKPFRELAKRFMGLLANFPPVPYLDNYFTERWQWCPPLNTDGEVVLRAKREAAISILTVLLGERLANQGVILEDVFVPNVFDHDEGEFGHLVDLLRQHVDYAPRPLARCINFQVLDTESGMPFNVRLPA